MGIYKVILTRRVTKRSLSGCLLLISGSANHHAVRYWINARLNHLYGVGLCNTDGICYATGTLNCKEILSFSPVVITHFQTFTHSYGGHEGVSVRGAACLSLRRSGTGLAFPVLARLNRYIPHVIDHLRVLRQLFLKPNEEAKSLNR